MREFIIFSSSLIFTASWGGAADLASTPEFFENKVRPVLSANCYACHTTSQVANLRLDSREGLLKGGQSGPAIVPGDAAQSLLIRVINHADPKVKNMPMGGKLKADEIAAITEWVKAGAPWPAAAAVAKPATGASREISAEMRNWWSFRPLAKPAVPQPKDAGWAKTEIDRFVLARLEQEGLKPVRAADRRTLIRRLTLDLTGLPPTVEEVDAFVADASPQAYAKVVDRLLASPAYGERWGRWWLDAVRYGEDDTRGLAPMGRGYEPYQYAYQFRDWAIRSVNDDVPYDQFVKAHLAADLLPEADRVKHLPALGFLGQGPWYYDLTEPVVARADERHERVDTTTRAFLGLTVGCARCHDHKYDPITMKDYYGLAGIFNASEYHEYPMVPKKVADEWTAEEKKIKDLERLAGEFSRTASEQLAMILARRTSDYMLAAWKVTGEPKTPIEQVANEMKLDREVLERWIKFLAKPPLFYPYVKPWQEMIKAGGTEEEAKKLAADFQKLVFDIVNEKADIKKKNERMMAKADVGDYDEVKSIPLPNGFKSFFDQHQLELKTLDRERINLWTDIFQRELDDEPDMNFRRGKPGLLVFRGFGLERQLSAEWRDYLNATRLEIEKMRKDLPPHFPFVHGVKDVEKPEDLKIHQRGNPYSLGEPTPRSFPQVLTAGGQREAFQKGSGRLQLAEAIAKHPLTARVLANRIWRGHFGSGIVETPSNFGLAGERPSHPELLDYLAAKFVEDGYSMKKLHREIVLSQVYQLASESNAANNQKDAANRLYWRANKNRMDAEQIRDSMLTVSGTLERKMYGPSGDLNDEFKRRTVYGKVSRFRLDTYLQLFDFPNPNISAEKRYVTNVPLQRLFFLNSDFVYLRAKALVGQVKDEATDEAKIRKLYRKLFYRDPQAVEVEAGLAYLAEEKRAKPEEKPAKPEGKPEATPEAKPMASGTSGDWAATSAAEEQPKPTAEKPAGAKIDDQKAPAPVRPASKKDAKKPAQKADPWTQYVRVLLSSSEFTFIE